ncbi:MAG TPA: PAS domain-containing sensor histidine kinase [Nitrososphaera sp.]|nr:PAS domain-containing sensor histidine kinase [Nitrososphaera sp.]
MKQQADGSLKGGERLTGRYSRTYRILESLYENSPVFYCTVSENGIILDCNETYARRIGYTRAESIGVSIFDHVDTNSLVIMHEYLEVWQKIGLLENLEVWLRRKEGDIFPALLSAASVHNEHGNVIACNIAFIDQTDIYKTKKDVERANQELKVKEQLKNEFIAIASHELRTPIQPLLGYAVLAKKGMVSQEEAWEGILKEARRLQQLANDILDVSRIESGSLMYQMERVAIESLLESAASSAGANIAKDVSIELIIDEGSKNLEVELDKSRITQVLSNVIGNAIKFTEKGSIKIECRAFAIKNKVEIKVSDTGAGISEQVLPNLFGKFVTKSVGETDGHGGTGLGLFISKAIVTAHKGEIFAYNNAIGGATFTIILPIDQSNIIYD